MNNERVLLNELYRPIIEKYNEIISCFIRIHGRFDCSSGFYNGHYHKNEDGIYQEDKYPIPVISVTNLCDIEIDFDNICITGKLTKAQLYSFDLNKLKDNAFEIYGVNNYLNDYGNNIEMEHIKERISMSEETEFFVSFYFSFESTSNDILKFLKFLQKNKFYY